MPSSPVISSSSRLRTSIFWIHLATGLFAGTVVLIMSVTGTLLMYERQVIAWADADLLEAPPAGASRLPIEAVLASVRREHPRAMAATVTLRADPAAPAAIGLGRDGTLYVNRYTGRVLGEGSQTVRRFFRFVTDVHRWLTLDGDRRAIGRAITGACNLAFLFLVVSGFYLWFPRSWRLTAVRNVTWFRAGLGGKARDFNWHNVIGFWCALPLFFVVLTAVLISYPWANTLLFRMTGSEPPPRVAPARAGQNGRIDRDPAPLDGLDRLWARAEQQVPGWRSITMRLPSAAEPTVTFSIDTGNGARPDKRSQLTLARTTSAVVRWEPYATQSRGRQLRAWARWIHTGEALGLVGQTVAGIASAGAALLVYSGFALSLRRFIGWRKRRSVAAVDRQSTAA
jgi:uncharacterized iron-regulated membrane protein